MARRKRRHGMSGWRKTVRKVGSAVGSVFILGPIWVPALDAFNQGGTAQQMFTNYKFSAIGINADNKLDQGFLLGTVIPRDVGLIALGMFTKWLSKRA